VLGDSSPDASDLKSVVSLVEVEKDHAEIEEAITKAIGLIGGVGRYVNKGDKVLVKPNFCTAKLSSSGVTTNLEIVDGLVKLVLEVGGSPIIGEGSIYPFSTSRVFEKLGAYELGTKYGIDVVDLNEDEIAEVSVPNPLVLKSIRIAKTALTCDKIISVAKLKMHEIVKVSLSLKNMKGVLPGIEKHVTHRKGLEKAIADLCSIIKPTLAVIDGIVGGAGATSLMGKPVGSNLILAGNDPVAVDAVASYIMGFNPGEIGVLKYASMKGVGTANIQNIKVRGEELENLRLKIAPLFSKQKFKDRLFRYFQRKIDNMFYRTTYPITRILPKAYPTMYCIGDLKISFDRNACTKCGRCVLVCPNGAIFLEKGYPKINVAACKSCLYCIEACSFGALSSL
jgi:uncharacterized protein (DUF362 family)/ferredoxin